MTYQQLLDKLNTIDPKRLGDTVTVFDPYSDEYMAVAQVEIADEQYNDVLDHGHLFLVLKS